MLKIFIGWDSRFPEPAEVLKFSLLKYSSIPLDIRFLNLSELNFNRQLDPLASTEFTYTRFLVPHLCGYEGKAIFMDNDMVCLSDIRELDELDMDSYALRVVKHNYRPRNRTKMYGCPQTIYPRKNWSSLMIMNCENLTLWTKEIVEKESGAFLHRFQKIADERIGDIPNTWNVLDHLDERTKLIHYTNGGPWFEQYHDHPHADLWFSMREEMLQCQAVPS